MERCDAIAPESDNTHIETAKRASYGGQDKLISSIAWGLLWALWLVPEAAVPTWKVSR